MATITTRKRKNGTTAYRAEVRIMREGTQIFKAVKTFSTRQQARTWAHTVEDAWMDRAQDPKPRHTVGDVIRLYLTRMDAIKPVARTRRFILEAIARSDLASIRATDLTPADLVRYCEQRRAAGAGPATVLLDFATLRTPFTEARALLDLDLDDTVFRGVRALLVRLGLVAKPKKRTRRPRAEELDRLLAHFRQRMARAQSLIPMADLVEFAIYSCMRQGEICHLLWADLDEARRTVVIRNRKAPQGKEGNDQEIPLLGPAFDVVMRQPHMDPRIFPFDEHSVSTAFTRSCTQLGITDLHFHDLRREGATRLMEMGYSVQEVATVTGHRDLNILWAVYTHIRPEHLHEKYK